ncbi:MAG: NAD(P)/FAD-dependent oxidoreductase [Chloroflexi bacterium]|nr:MAG: NAD(P)/FAD-dependent oxidoreductase [Chloroflexota bacterium]
MKERDVIVVGAGPAGATTATILAQKGLDVLLLDRAQFPRDKTCGDAVPSGAIETLGKLGMADKIAQSVSRGELYPLEQMYLASPKGHELVATFTKGNNGEASYVAPRLYFDALIQQHAIDSGAEFVQAHVKEPVVENGRITGIQARINDSTETIPAKMVIGADGVTSVITRTMRPKQNQHVDKHRAVALRAYIEDIEEMPKTVEFYMYDEILPGYAWIFPTGNHTANIGLGMRLDIFRKHKIKLEDLLKKFLAFPDIKKRLLNGGQLRDIATWQLNFGSQKHLQHTFDGALLVGDAAGFINPLTGGGIHNAIISATLATQTIVEAFAKGDTSRAALKVYEERCHQAMWRSMNRSYFLQRTLMHFPFMIDFLVKRMKENSMFAQTFLSKL